MDELGEIKHKIKLRDIKSPFIIKKIFSFLSEKKLLYLIIYNKELQKIFSVDIKDYIKISGKYKIGGKNGKVREYNIKTNKLIFEGEYLKGKRNGLGKEYYDNKVRFEGEYLNGKRNGRGKEYYNDGILEFEGKIFKWKKIEWKRL